MTGLDIAQRRLINRNIALATFKKLGDVVSWLGAVQAQDYAGAKWAIGLHLQGAAEVDIELAFTDSPCLRLQSEHRHPVWSHNFMLDTTRNGRSFRILNGMDEFTRECLAIPVARALKSEVVQE